MGRLWMDRYGRRKEGGICSRSSKGREVAISGLCSGMLEWLSVTGSQGDEEEWTVGDEHLLNLHLWRLPVPAWHPMRDPQAGMWFVITVIL